MKRKLSLLLLTTLLAYACHNQALAYNNYDIAIKISPQNSAQCEVNNHQAICKGLDNVSAHLIPVQGEDIYLPINEGKYFKSDDQRWLDFLNEESYSPLSSLTMPFIAIGSGDIAYVYIFDSKERSLINFKAQDNKLNIDFSMDFINPHQKELSASISIYTCDNDINSIAQTYAQHIKIKNIPTLTKRNIYNQKLIGAPHFYLWDQSHDGIDIIQDLYTHGLKKAWIGFDEWKVTRSSKELVNTILNFDYLVAPYDNYQDIQEPGKEAWGVASFEDSNLYYQYTIQNQDGTYPSAFLNQGRLLNPIFAMKAVEERSEKILNETPFNSYFVDCDATGEVLDDFTINNETTRLENLNARIERLNYFSQKLKLITGSENGHDFAIGAIDFAHGLDMGVFTWMDKDMSDPKSEYYMGEYYTNEKNEVPPRYVREMKVKDYLLDIYYNPQYTIPLFKLVYNQHLITANHWEMGSLKVVDYRKHRMLHEIAFNSAPLYHLSMSQWKKYKNIILKHSLVWSNIATKAMQYPMTKFSYIDNNRLIQQSQFSDNLIITVNYTHQAYKYKEHTIPSMSALIEIDQHNFIYTPEV